jgi:hypothetical protein
MDATRSQLKLLQRSHGSSPLGDRDRDLEQKIAPMEQGVQAISIAKTDAKYHVRKRSSATVEIRLGSSTAELQGDLRSAC